jgi:hypothetical protein
LDAIASAQKEIEQINKDTAPLREEQVKLVEQREALGPEKKEERAKLQKQIDANAISLKASFDRIQRQEAIIAESKQFLKEFETAADDDDKPKFGADLSVQYNPADLGKDQSGKTVNLPSVESQLVFLYRNYSVTSIDKELPFRLHQVSIFKEPALVLDAKWHKKDDQGKNWAAPSAGFQITAVNLEWKLGKEDFIEFGLPLQPVIVDTDGNIKWQAAAELDVHLDPAAKPTPKLTVFATGNVGGTYTPADPDGRRRLINAGGAGVGIKASF